MRPNRSSCYQVVIFPSPCTRTPASAAINSIFSSDTYALYASRFLLDPSEGVESAASTDTPGDLWRDPLFFFYNQPRLHCIYNAPVITNSGRFPSQGGGTVPERTCPAYLKTHDSDLMNPPMVRRLITTELLVAQMDLRLKIFDKDVLYQLLNVDPNSREMASKEFDQSSSDAFKLEEVLRILNHDIEHFPARMCTAPSLYTISLNDMIEGFYWQSTNATLQAKLANNTIRIDHRYAPASMMAVVVQCSPLPITIDMEFEFRNVNNSPGSGEYYMTSIVYFIFMVLYMALFVIFLIMMIPCGRQQRRAPVVVVKKKKEEVHGDSSEDSMDSFYSNSSDEEEDRRRSGSSKKSKPVRKRITDDEDTEEDNSCSARVRRFFQNHFGFRHILIFYPPLQWMTLVTIIIKVLYCIFLAANYSILTGISFIEEEMNGLTVLSLILYVSAGSLLFAEELLVGVGWGVAYNQLRTSTIIILSLGTIVAFVLFVLVATCHPTPMSQSALVFNANPFARHRAGTSCLVFSYLSIAYQIAFHVHNAVRMFLVTSTLAKAILPKSSFRELSKEFMMHQAMRNKVLSLANSYKANDAANVPSSNYYGGNYNTSNGENFTYAQYYNYLRYIRLHYKQTKPNRDRLVGRKNHQVGLVDLYFHNDGTTGREKSKKKKKTASRHTVHSRRRTERRHTLTERCQRSMSMRKPTVTTNPV
ncbi:hypothetical protein AGDE_16515 [Angomonas deanei]|uniref:Uncharacterized protein n=1 Tax=Angomonas deanei TaxID=59799 RepID=A0A7G2CTY8_9TRYP|nr:hypothetical protein AGDE_16515 [Angomonas deanei]CAD2222667.1 hypothetical protein, conserved [Angomonas deanei]|eukprot:EPY16953.1 hypothetical protein AGDE_16515 [Angomonas deanei]